MMNKKQWFSRKQNGSIMKRATTALLSLTFLLELGPVVSFAQEGETGTEEIRVLDCPFEPTTGKGYADYYIHEHDESCFDENWNLVCLLEEKKLHD